MSPVRSVTYVSGPDPGIMERAMGIEPTSEAWEASILPLYDARSLFLIVLRNRFSVQRFRSLTRLHSGQSYGDTKQACNSYRTPGRHAGGLRKSSTPSLLSKP